MIKLETHCHTFGTSICADNDDINTIDRYVEAGYGGIIATNHFSRGAYYDWCKGETQKEKIDSLFETIDAFKEKCNKRGLKCFWGLEIRRSVDGGYQEFTIIGLPRKVFYKEPLIYTYSQTELFALANEYGAFMYQTHPFRDGVVLGDPKYMHGAEAFNGHYHHVSRNEKARKFVKDNNLIGLSGTDFHHFGQPITAGIYLPEDIETEKQLVKFLFDNKFELIVEEELYLKELERYNTNRK